MPSLFRTLAALTLPLLGSSTAVLLPLYIYPGDSAVNWNPLFNSLSAHPSVPFTIIVNPGSGPGTTTYPDTNYIAGINTLHTFPNARVIGYAHVSNATQPLSAVQTNVTRYAGWSDYTGGANISVSGIFLDEAPSDDSSASITYMQNALNIVKSTVPSPSPFVVFNPGYKTSAAYFSPNPPDLSVQFENYYSEVPASGPITTYPTGETARSAVIAHDVPSTSDATSFVKRAVSDGVGAVWAASDYNYGNLDYLDAVIAGL